MSKAFMDQCKRSRGAAALRLAGFEPTEIGAALAAVDARVTEVQSARALERPVLLTQAQKSRQLGVSRFTIRKLTQLGKLHPVELLPGLLRYRADELA